MEDVNDNAPEFVNLPYYAVVQVEAEQGSAIFRVSADDRDYGLNGEVTYSLKEKHRHFQVRATKFSSAHMGGFAVFTSLYMCMRLMFFS